MICCMNPLSTLSLQKSIKNLVVIVNLKRELMCNVTFRIKEIKK